MNNSATSGAGFAPGCALTGVCLAIVWALLPGAAPAQIGFEDATPGSGITHDGESWGASWGDLNADGWPDLFVNNHRGEPALLVNQGNGAFQDRWREVDIWSEFPLLDQHGASWADFNNDGYEDLFISLGSRDDMQLLLNENGVLTDRTQFYGLDAYTSWPGRLPAWLDYNDDGLLDWIMSTRGFAKTFRQVPGGWVDDIFVVGPACQNTQYTQLLDVDDDGRLDAVCDNQTSWPNKVYDTSTIPFTSLASLIPQQGAGLDQRAAGAEDLGFVRQPYAQPVTRTFAHPLLYLAGQVMRVDDDVAHAPCPQAIQGMPEQGLAPQRHQGFRHQLGERPQARPQAGRQNQRLARKWLFARHARSLTPS